MTTAHAKRPTTRKSGPGRYHDKAPAPRNDKKAAPRFVAGAKLARRAINKTLGVKE